MIAGDIWINTSNNKSYRWNGSSWESMIDYIEFDLEEGFVLRLNRCVQSGQPAIGISVVHCSDGMMYEDDIAGTSVPLKEFRDKMMELVSILKKGSK